MTRAIALLVPLLVGAPLASAQQTFVATSGTMVDPGNGFGPSYSIAGPGFSTSGSIVYQGDDPASFPFMPGNVGGLNFYGDTENPNLANFSFTVQGVAWAPPNGTPSDGNELVDFRLAQNLPVSGPGTYFGTFTFQGSLLGAPESIVSANPTLGCGQIACSLISITGGGTAMLDVVSAPNSPGSLEFSEVLFTIKGAPEPSTGSLLLIAFAGLAVVGRRRHRDATVSCAP